MVRLRLKGWMRVREPLESGRDGGGGDGDRDADGAAASEATAANAAWMCERSSPRLLFLLILEP